MKNDEIDIPLGKQEQAAEDEGIVPQ